MRFQRLFDPGIRRARACLVFAVVAIALVSGCKVPPPTPPLVKTVAILLFDNESNDINADDTMRRYVYLAMKPSVYEIQDIKQTADFLTNVGIIDGGQLPIVDPVKLGKDLGVQALLYGYVEHFGYTNIGFYVSRKVSLGLKLVDVGSGAVLWENSQTVANRKLTLDKDEAQKAFFKGLGEQAVDKLFKSPLEEEARQVTIKTLRTLPGFRFMGFARDEDTPNAAEATGKAVIKDQIRKR